MKVTSATVRLCLKKSRASKSGEYSSLLVVCYHGRVEKSTGISCAIQFWDNGREIVKAKCPNAPVLNKMLNDIKQRVIERRTSLELNGRGYTAQMLIESLSQPKEMKILLIWLMVCPYNAKAVGLYCSTAKKN